MSEADTRKREKKGLTEAMNYFLIEKGIIITADQEEELEIDGKIIEIKPAYKVLLEEKLMF
jgi:predicted AAA+ superfamily ATPase